MVKEGFDMKCPFCDAEMIHGYLNCGNAIWSERKHKISTLPDSIEKYALHLETPLLSPHHIESFTDVCRGIMNILTFNNLFTNKIEMIFFPIRY